MGKATEITRPAYRNITTSGVRVLQEVCVGSGPISSRRQPMFRTCAVRKLFEGERGYSPFGTDPALLNAGYMRSDHGSATVLCQRFTSDQSRATTASFKMDIEEATTMLILYSGIFITRHIPNSRKTLHFDSEHLCIKGFRITAVERGNLEERGCGMVQPLVTLLVAYRVEAFYMRRSYFTGSATNWSRRK
jgi:hypothetical protein